MPLLIGINRAKDLCQGETLCGACQDACPVNIDIPGMLLALRAKLADGDPKWDVVRVSGIEKTIYKMWSLIIRNRQVYDFFLRMASFGQKLFSQNNGMICRLPPPLDGWAQHRDIHPIAEQSFMQRWKKGL